MDMKEWKDNWGEEGFEDLLKKSDKALDARYSELEDTIENLNSDIDDAKHERMAIEDLWNVDRKKLKKVV
jgi:hypothetical protein